MQPLAPWLTRQPLADRISAWALRPTSSVLGVLNQGGAREARVLEPSAGHGALAVGLLKAGLDPKALTLVELHAGRAKLLREAFAFSEVVHRDFTLWVEDLFEDGGPTNAPFGLAVMNPPSDDGTDTDHVEAATIVASRVVCLVRLAFVTGTGRGRKIFNHCKLTRQVVLSSRPDFEDHRSPEERAAAMKKGKGKSTEEADGSPKHDWTVLELVRMTGRVQGWTREADPVDRVEVTWW